MTSDNRKRVRRIIEPVQAFIRTEAFSGLILVLAAGLALGWANSPWDSSYHDLFATNLSVDLGPLDLHNDLRGWIDDGLMTLFFFVVGLEMKRELVAGELAGRDKALLPAVAAVGGMIVPALIYTTFNAGGDGGRGWGIPMATDAAFALGVLALVRGLPPSVRTFLLAVAVVDDIGSIAVVAAFYSSDLDFAWLAVAIATLATIFAMRRAGWRSPIPYVVAAAAVWLATFEAGTSTAVAGVLLGLLTPSDRAVARDAPGTAERLELVLHPVAAFAIVPLFALANAGIDVSSGSLTSAVTLGVFAGRVIGKPAGIVLFSWLAVRAGLASLPRAMSWLHLLGVGVLGGMGFTVALLVNELAFGSDAPSNDAKLGTICAALVAGTLGYGVLMFGRTRDATGK